MSIHFLHYTCNIFLYLMFKFRESGELWFKLSGGGELSIDFTQLCIKPNFLYTTVWQVASMYLNQRNIKGNA